MEKTRTGCSTPKGYVPKTIKESRKDLMAQIQKNPPSTYRGPISYCFNCGGLLDEHEINKGHHDDC